MTLIEVARFSDVPEGSLKHIEINGKEILLANVGGTIYAMDDRCGHMNASLAMGVLDGTICRMCSSSCPIRCNDREEGARRSSGRRSGCGDGQDKNGKDHEHHKNP